MRTLLSSLRFEREEGRFFSFLFPEDKASRYLPFPPLLRVNLSLFPFPLVAAGKVPGYSCPRAYLALSPRRSLGPPLLGNERP